MTESISTDAAHNRVYFLRFLKAFAPIGSAKKQFPAHVRFAVYARMRHAFHDGANREELLRYFRKTFHPDVAPSCLSKEEAHQVFVRGEGIFAPVSKKEARIVSKT